MNFVFSNVKRKAICNIVVPTLIVSCLCSHFNVLAAASDNKTATNKVEITETTTDDSEADSIVSTTGSTTLASIGEDYSVEVESLTDTVVEENTELASEDLEITDNAIEEEVVIVSTMDIDYFNEPCVMYVNVDNYLNARIEPITGVDNVIGGFKRGSKITVLGTSIYDPTWSVVEYKEGIAFVSNEYLTPNQEDVTRIPEYTEEPQEWNGKVLNSNNGRVQGPSGSETYYNLNMNRCIEMMNKLGYYFETWVRDDGVKMFGDYVMVAANLEIRPKGSLVETSLGTGIVVDTGEFVNWNNTGIDVAVTW